MSETLQWLIGAACVVVLFVPALYVLFFGGAFLLAFCAFVASWVSDTWDRFKKWTKR